MPRFSLVLTPFIMAATIVCAEPTQSQNIEKKVTTIDLKNAFNASPIIYSILCGLSIASLTVALSTFVDIQKKLKVSQNSLNDTQQKLMICRYDEASSILDQKTEALAFMLKQIIESRKSGPQGMREAMKHAGKRCMVSSWQKVSLLSDIALLAPMIGLLGTVLGMFYAFYDVNRSIESLASLFDGLGVSVGTTVAGLVVALSSMTMQTILKHRLISRSTQVESACEQTISLIGEP